MIIEEEDRFYQYMDQYDKYDNTPYTPVTNGDMESSHPFTLSNTNKFGNKSIKSDFCIDKRQL